MKNSHAVFSRRITLFISCIIGCLGFVNAQGPELAWAGMHEPPLNPTPYVVPEPEDVVAVIERVHEYLESVTPVVLVDKNSGQTVSDYKDITRNTVWKKGDFPIISYEWGVTYAAMLLAFEVTGDIRYRDYTTEHMAYIIDLAEYYNEHPALDVDKHSPVHIIIKPDRLDHSGSMCAAMIKSLKYFKTRTNYDPVIDNLINQIHKEQYRLTDGTLARNVPHPNTLWLDDMFMSIPALAQMGKYTGNSAYFDDAVKQVLQFSKRMFNREKNLYMHGWVEQMNMHPQFHWARANGWAVLAMIELLDVLPQTHPGYEDVVIQLQSHIEGLVQYQDGSGFWHQLLDRSDSYLETSATAMFTYAIARAINMGLLDPYACIPIAILGWNAVATMVNDHGQVEGTCIGTGMAFDPSFYYYRDVDVLAAHGYGPLILAGSEVIRLLQSHEIELFDSAVHYNIDPRYRF